VHCSFCSQSPPLHYQLGQAFERLGNQDEALERYNQALHHRPVRNQGLVHIGLDFIKEAIESIKQVQFAIRDLQSQNDAQVSDR